VFRGGKAVPIYEYQCTKCGEIFEAFQKITDKPVTRCRFCDGKVERLISQSSFQLKGSGWYLTDYAKKSSAPAPGAAADAAKSGGKEGAGDKAESTSKKAEKSST
jgi:putative FmdB family regulatory protein